MSSDRVNEVYEGQILDQQNQTACRLRIHWMCAHAAGERVLDFGCSQGVASLILGREGCQVTGIDVDPSVIEYAQTELEREEDFVKANITFELVKTGRLGYASDTFDCILLGDVIERLAYPEALLRELRRVLKPRGRLIITTPFGVLPHPDHMQTYYLSNFIELMRPLYAIDQIEILEKSICCVALAADDEAASADVVDARRLLRQTETVFERAEWTSIDWRRKLREQYEQSTRQAELLQAKVNEKIEELGEENRELRRVHAEELACAQAERQKIVEAQHREHAEEMRRLERACREEHERDLRKVQASLKAVTLKQQVAARQADILKSRLGRQKDQLDYFKAELKLRVSEVRYRLGDALVRSCFHPAEIFLLPSRIARLGVEGLRRKRRRLKEEQAEAVLLSSGSSSPALKIAPTSGAVSGDGHVAVKPKHESTGAAKADPEITFTPTPRPKAAPRLPLKAGVIMDEFTIECFRDECNLITFTPANWKKTLSSERPDILFVESTWKGNDGAWRYKVNRTEYKRDDPLPQLVEWCKSQNIPTVFWNKEYPPNFERFIAAAGQFDRIFTTDEDCIPRYRERVGHDRIESLPFAAQPGIHNPIDSKRKRLGRLCFAGTYHRDKYPQRQRDLETLLRPARKRGLTIFDRQHGYGQEDRYSFPPEYHEFVRGGLSYMEMVEAYKAYEVFLNINSVRESPTMFSRRVLELLACGTAVISTPAAGIERLLGRDAVAEVDSEEQAASWMDRLLQDQEFRDRMVTCGQRRVFTEHTYELRLRRIIDALGLSCPALRRRVSVVTVTNRPNCLDQVLDNYRRQKYADKELIVVLNSDDFNIHEAREKFAPIPDARVFQRPESHTLGQCLNYAVDQSEADFIAKFDDDDFYGEHFLTDQVNAFLYSGTEIVGKRAYYAYLENQRCLAMRFDDLEHQRVKFVSGATLVVRRELFEVQRFPEDVQRGVDTKFQQACMDQGFSIYSTDRFNFVATRLKSTDQHTWRISDEEFLQKCRIVAYLDDYRAQVCV